MAIWRWNENIIFDISVRDVPRGARLCLAIYAVYGSKKTKKKTGKSEPKGVSFQSVLHLQMCMLLYSVGEGTTGVGEPASV